MNSMMSVIEGLGWIGRYVAYLIPVLAFLLCIGWGFVIRYLVMYLRRIIVGIGRKDANRGQRDEMDASVLPWMPHSLLWGASQDLLKPSLGIVHIYLQCIFCPISAAR